MTTTRSKVDTPQEDCRSFTLLCVDDDPCISDGLARCLAEYGIQVIRAYDGLQGFWSVIRDKPDAVLCDLAMPNGSGIELIECIRSNSMTEALTVLVLSGSRNSCNSRRLRSLGVAAVLNKPVCPSEIVIELLAAGCFSSAHKG